MLIYTYLSKGKVGLFENHKPTIVALYDKVQTQPLPDIYGKNLTFKTGGVDGCD